MPRRCVECPWHVPVSFFVHCVVAATNAAPRASPQAPRPAAEDARKTNRREHEPSFSRITLAFPPHDTNMRALPHTVLRETHTRTQTHSLTLLLVDNAHTDLLLPPSSYCVSLRHSIQEDLFLLLLLLLLLFSFLPSLSLTHTHTITRTHTDADTQFCVCLYTLTLSLFRTLFPSTQLSHLLILPLSLSLSHPISTSLALNQSLAGF